MIRNCIFFSILFMLVSSCSLTEFNMKDEMLYVEVKDGMSIELIKEFIKIHEGYLIEEDKVLCSNLEKKILLQRYLVFNDDYFNSTTFPFIDICFKSYGELFSVSVQYSDVEKSGINNDEKEKISYLTAGEYGIVIPWPQEYLIDCKWDDEYVITDNFVDQDDIFYGVQYNLIDKEKVLLMDEDVILKYFNNQSDSGIWRLKQKSSIFTDLNINFATLVAFLISKGYYVFNDCETGEKIISLH